MYNFSSERLNSNISRFLKTFNDLVARRNSVSMAESKVTDLPRSTISWSRGLLKRYERGEQIPFLESDTEIAFYRPFVTKFLHRNAKLIETNSRTSQMFPPGKRNLAIVTTTVGSSTFSALIVDKVFDLNFLVGESFPRFSHSLPGSGQEENSLFVNDEPSTTDNISDWALKMFRNKYSDDSITKDSIFTYVYGVLNSREYIKRYGNDAKKSGPKVPFVKEFWEFSRIGSEMLDVHLGQVGEEIDLNISISDSAPSGTDKFYVRKIAFGKTPQKTKDTSTIIVNDHITITGIPDEVYEFDINGRSAVEWVMDQYLVTTDKETLITQDPNEFTSSGDFVYLHLLKVLQISLRTAKLRSALPALSVF
jgi:predicted helicase